MSTPNPVASRNVAGTGATDSPVDAFEGAITPTKPGPLYTIGLAIVAFAMVLLPLVYIGLIVLTAWAVYWHLRYDTWMLSGGGSRGSLFKLLAYLAPAMAGGILTFFMVKPFFARRAAAPDPITLDPAREPLLFAFVNKICALVGAPAPGRIDVDCQVNASASLSRGVLSRSLVLTIGLPLASGLDLREFAGVLAHEFGHFAQGAGMRLTYIIRNINHWFARVVFERDEWDLKLAHAAKSIDFRVGVFLHATRACVWLTRRILWLLMHAGNAISCFMLRQMEYDADSYEAKLAGSDAFQSTAARLRLLNAATHIAYDDVRQSWASQRLPENLPLLIEHKAQHLAPEIRTQLTTAGAAEKTGWFDTHPCDADRVRAVQSLAESGIFRRTEPATTLFADFADLSRAVTRHHYEKHLELEFTDQNLMAAEEILRESSASAEADAMIRKYYGKVDITLQPLLLTRELPPLADPEAARIQWAEARRLTESRRAEAEGASDKCLEHLRRLPDFVSANRLARAGFTIELKDFGLPQSIASGNSEAATRAAVEGAQEAVADHINHLEPFLAALRQRVTLALQFALAQPAPERGANGGEPDAGHSLDRRDAIALLAAVGGGLGTIREIVSKIDAFILVAKNQGNTDNIQKVHGVINELVTDLQRLIGVLQTNLQSLPYPFPHAGGRLSVADYARSETKADNDWHQTYLDSDSHIHRLSALYYRLIGKVLAIVDATERALDDVETSAKADP